MEIRVLSNSMQSMFAGWWNLNDFTGIRNFI